MRLRVEAVKALFGLWLEDASGIMPQAGWARFSALDDIVTDKAVDAAKHCSIYRYVMAKNVNVAALDRQCISSCQQCKQESHGTHVPAGTAKAITSATHHPSGCNLVLPEAVFHHILARGRDWSG